MDDLWILAAKGFHVSDAGGGFATIRWPNAAPDTAFRVRHRDGMLELVKDRSATHRMLAEALGR